MPFVRVGPLPPWMPERDLLGSAEWLRQPDGSVTASLTREQAADVQARLRGLAFAGLDLAVQVRPALKRPLVRAGRLREARARRNTTPGFEHPMARLDEEGRRSLTPESLALDLGHRARGRSVLDLTCGAGGNAIGFARAGCAVTAVELSPERLADARFNANLYKVASKITFKQGDALQAIQAHTASLVFIDPPWAGWDHRRTTLDDLPLLGALLERMPTNQSWWAKVPPSFDVEGLQVSVEPWFGRASGDRHRVKFLLLQGGQ
ncbi:MAG: methyltransferase domain-containing protein [Myxococcota bacterium]